MAVHETCGAVIYCDEVMNMKKTQYTAAILAICIALAVFCVPMRAENATQGAPVPDCRSAILIEAQTGQVLYEQNADESLPPASVTKIMTLLLVMEAIEEGRLRYEDTVCASAHACSMGGSQIYLKEGEQMSVEDLVKSVVIASANDAALALAEHLAGTEEAFVAQMNQRAEELGLTGTHFENTNGLDDTVQNHVSTARDIAIMSQALLRHERITEFSSIWMDSIRDGAFGLTNTNRLVRFYPGATGLKTGSTAKAKFCISATAEREGMTLICVIMAAPTRDVRNAAATSLLDYGFSSFRLVRHRAELSEPIRVQGGKQSLCAVEAEEFCVVLPRGEAARISHTVSLPQTLAAPLQRGDKVGEVVYTVGEKEIGRSDVLTTEEVEKIDFGGLFLRLIAKMSLSF